MVRHDRELSWPDGGTGAGARPGHRRLGGLLLAEGAIDRHVLSRALAEQKRLGVRLGEVLRDAGRLPQDVLGRALAAQLGSEWLHPLPPGDGDLAGALPAEVALRLRAVPVRRTGGGVLLIATDTPERIDAVAAGLPDDIGPHRLVLTARTELEARMARTYGPDLARRAQRRVAFHSSCRRWNGRRVTAGVLVAVAVVALAAWAWPVAVLRAGLAAGLLCILTGLVLRLAARRAVGARRAARPVLRDAALPRMSILVPLNDEPAIVPRLVERMSDLDYPGPLLEVMLILEAGDARTLAALDAIDLPHRMRVIRVPPGRPRTKPRAMNYALDFARGDVVGIYDAEDAPDADQLRRVAERFAAADDRLACLQGRLDFYNADRNVLSRCFAIEYANWFRTLLPGLERMGLVIPLGGTTLFFRRAALEDVGAWDAWNVTEDADLGVRLARAGYRVEVIETTTREEANAAIGPWIAQRARWAKGYVMTWAVHAARPGALLADLGWRRTIGFHALFLTAILGPLLLPLTWSLAVVPFGVPHPALSGLPPWGGWALGAGLVAMTLTDMGLNAAGCRGRAHRRLRLWVVVMPFYYVLGALAAYRAAWDLLTRPFHWNKTAHGAFGGADRLTPVEPLPGGG
ncbi:glycosyltransferase family 2 protein [Jannaschia sp. LMIT008]|uniref:glycosyltransferase family 2 protein n=1 Tax=Jannaschia maritima TaxID=3032585 RepID=UPI002811453C|nr:glycosyltransferase family 2 protein [Jannaschia sp. LMIT008]